MKYQDNLKLKMVLGDGFTDGFMQYIDDCDRLEDSRDACIAYLLHKLRKNANLSPLVRLMPEYIEIKTDLKTPKIKLPQINIEHKKIPVKHEEDSESDSSSDTVIFNEEHWKLKRSK